MVAQRFKMENTALRRAVLRTRLLSPMDNVSLILRFDSMATGVELYLIAGCGIKSTGSKFFVFWYKAIFSIKS